MPELAFGYLIGALATAGLTALHLYLQQRKLNSKEMQHLQKNLKQVNLFWSESESSLKDYSENAVKLDRLQSTKSIWLAGIGFIIFSWLGFVFQFILMLSLRFLAVKRIERRLFESELVGSDLAFEKIRLIINTLV